MSAYEMSDYKKILLQYFTKNDYILISVDFYNNLSVHLNGIVLEQNYDYKLVDKLGDYDLESLDIVDNNHPTPDFDFWNKFIYVKFVDMFFSFYDRITPNYISNKVVQSILNADQNNLAIHLTSPDILERKLAEKRFNDIKVLKKIK